MTASFPWYDLPSVRWANDALWQATGFGGASSLAAVREGLADMASIDAVTWRILERDAPSSVRGLRVLDRICSAPAPPYVVRQAGPRETLVPRITAAMNDLATLPARRALLIQGVIPVTIDDYASVLVEYQAVAHRIPALEPQH